MLNACASYYPAGSAPLAKESNGQIARDLRRTVSHLAGDIGERNVYRPAKLELAAAWIEENLQQSGYYTSRQPVETPALEKFRLDAPVTAYNIEAIKPGTDLAHESIIFGAHYDSKAASESWMGHSPPQPERPGTPGANDNASGIAALLHLARALRDQPTRRTIRFVAFTNEEPPFFVTDAMGSRVYARKLTQDNHTRPICAIIPDLIGVYSQHDNSKRLEMADLFGLPDETNYVAFLFDWNSTNILRTCAQGFQKNSSIPLRTVSFPRLFERVAWSDDSSFQRHGIPAFTVTDTAFLRSDHYHETSDTTDTLDYETMAEVVYALEKLTLNLANPDAITKQTSKPIASTTKRLTPRSGN